MHTAACPSVRLHVPLVWVYSEVVTERHPSGVRSHDRRASSRYSPISESQEFCSETCFHTLSLVKHGILCGTRPWSAVGRRSELSHHTLDDRHEGGAKSGARGAVRFSRAVPALLVSALHIRSTPRAFAR